MQLDERKWIILQAIIKTYLETGEPVGSRTISKYPGLNLSSATIRNEMSDLEEMGYIIQPHTSAGRIPSDAGYRLYVDRMHGRKRPEDGGERQRSHRDEGTDDPQTGPDGTGFKAAGEISGCQYQLRHHDSGPQYHRTKLKFIQLSIVDEGQILQ